MTDQLNNRTHPQISSASEAVAVKGVAAVSSPEGEPEPVASAFEPPVEPFARLRWMAGECEVLARDLENRAGNFGDDISLEIGAKEAARYRADAAAIRTVLAATPTGGRSGDGTRPVAKRAIVTPQCRQNRGVEGAADEALHRLREEFLLCVAGNPNANYHFTLEIERLPDA